MGVLGKVIDQITNVTDRNFRVDGRMIEANLTPVSDSQGRVCPRLELRPLAPKPHAVSYGGNHWTTYACMKHHGPFGLQPTSWNCTELGIAGPSVSLPVYIEAHAIRRLRERIPLVPLESWLHRFMVDSLDDPSLIIPRSDQHYLVEFCLGCDRLGYFVVEILPHMVLVKTFLFLTMQGTPEAQKLRETLGLYRNDIEYYELDNFFTLVASDVNKDPFLVRVLTECGCGHLLSWIDPDSTISWIDRFGEKLKKTFDLRDAGEGFMVGRKWTKWTV